MRAGSTCFDASPHRPELSVACDKQGIHLPTSAAGMAKLEPLLAPARHRVWLNLILLTPKPLHSPPSAAPKRDHDEWLVWWRLGGSAVVPAQVQSTSAGSGSPVDAASNARQAAEPARVEAATQGGGRHGFATGCMPGGYQAYTVRSDAARDAPGPTCHKPKTPIGRRGVSLTYIAD